MATTMEDQLLQLLSDTQSSSEGPRQQAELHLKQAQTNPAFPTSLAAIASHASVSPNIRQAALLVLRNFVEKNWSGQDEDGPSLVTVPDTTKEQLRMQLLELATSNDAERKVKSLASLVVSRIANVDFPEEWPTLIPALLHIIPNATDSQLHGALKVLSDLVDDTLGEDEFFLVARDIVKVVYDVAVNESRKMILRALAVSVFRLCFNLMDMVKGEHGAEVKAFAEEALTAWSPFFLAVMKIPMPERPPQYTDGSSDPASEAWRGIVSLKLQVIKTFMKIRSVFPALLLPQSPVLFSATWEELSLLQEAYKDMYVDNDLQGRLEDADGLPFTLDFLVLEELDFLQSCLRASPVQKELEGQLQANSGPSQTPWFLDFMKLAVSYAQIPKEAEDLWDIDVSLFLSEESSATANYTARTAAGDLLIKLGEWLHQGALEGLLAYTQGLFNSESATWRTREASLFLLTQLMNDFLDVDRAVSPELASQYLSLIQYSIERADEPLLRARGYLVAGILAQSVPNIGTDLLDRTIRAINADDTEVVKVSCIKSLEGFIKAPNVPAHCQVPIIASISEFLYAKDLTDLEDADDLYVTLIETLRAAMRIDHRIAISGDSGALDLLFFLARHGAASFQVTMLVTETFEEILSGLPGPEAFTSLCEKVLPSLTGAFNVGNMTGDDPLVELAAELLALITENGSEPLPPGFIAAALPKLNQLLMNTTEGGVLRPGVEAVKYMIVHDHQQVFDWHDENNRSGLEVCLLLIDRLLGPMMEDEAASEVGGLAAELVEKAGQERLGPFLEQLLQGVASRLATAEAAALIQSLILVFARLSLVGAQDVVQFLSQISINGQSGLQVVLGKWLENSINFTGYDEIRQNVIALSKLYSLNDQRVVQTMVRGDLVVPDSNIIMTRSRAKKNPDQYTIVPANLKVIKVLIEELLSASGHQDASAAAAAAAEYLDEGEDDGWEDMPNALDLALGSIKSDLMAWGEGSGLMRHRDDETQAFLIEFFIKAAQENTAGFNELYAALTDDEKQKLNELAQ